MQRFFKENDKIRFDITAMAVYTVLSENSNQSTRINRFIERHKSTLSSCTFKVGYIDVDTLRVNAICTNEQCYRYNEDILVSVQHILPADEKVTRALNINAYDEGYWPLNISITHPGDDKKEWILKSALRLIKVEMDKLRTTTND